MWLRRWWQRQRRVLRHCRRHKAINATCVKAGVETRLAFTGAARAATDSVDGGCPATVPGRPSVPAAGGSPLPSGQPRPPAGRRARRGLRRSSGASARKSRTDADGPEPSAEAGVEARRGSAGVESRSNWRCEWAMVDWRGGCMMRHEMQMGILVCALRL